MNQADAKEPHSTSTTACWEPAPSDLILDARYKAGITDIDWHIRRTGCWRSWNAMLLRTREHVAIRLRKLYFDRDITVCDRWKESFWNFYVDMGGRPYASTLARVDDEKGFYKGNCWWTKPLRSRLPKSKDRYLMNDAAYTDRQIANKLAIDVHHLRKMKKKLKPITALDLSPDLVQCLDALQTNRMSHAGKTKTINQWAERIGVHSSSVTARLYSGTIPATILKSEGTDCA